MLAERITDAGVEAVELRGGQFSFDAVRGLALFYDASVELASDAGWFSAPRTDMTAQTWKRPKFTALAPTDVRAIGVDSIGPDKQLFLCLSSAADGATSITSRISRENVVQTGACGNYAGDDDLWRYTNAITDGSIEMATINKTNIRTLKTGRFTDDIMIGMPLAVRTNTMLAYLLPTEAGVLQIDDTLVKQSIQGTFGPELRNSVPAGLYLQDFRFV